MKTYYWLLILGLTILTSCQNKQSEQTSNEITHPVVTKQACYSYSKNGDTATMTTMISGHIVTGELNYMRLEKDNNKGSFQGEMRGDTLIADYTFNSEGKQSSRQVAFLEKDGKLIEGYGEVIEKDGKMVFKNLSKLNFSKVTEFTKVECQ